MLRAPFDLLAVNVGFTLHRDVTARITPLGQGGRAYAISWQPVEHGPFPSLSGTVFIGTSETDEDQSILRSMGTIIRRLAWRVKCSMSWSANISLRPAP
jgi:hypothetical protein